MHRGQVDAFVDAAQVEEAVDLVRPHVRHDHHQCGEYGAANITNVLRQSTFLIIVTLGQDTVFTWAGRELPTAHEKQVYFQPWFFLLRVVGVWRAMFPVRPEEKEEDVLSDASIQARLRRVCPISSRRGRATTSGLPHEHVARAPLIVTG